MSDFRYHTISYQRNIHASLLEASAIKTFEIIESSKHLTDPARVIEMIVGQQFATARSITILFKSEEAGHHIYTAFYAPTLDTHPLRNLAEYQKDFALILRMTAQQHTIRDINITLAERAEYAAFQHAKQPTLPVASSATATMAPMPRASTSPGSRVTLLKSNPLPPSVQAAPQPSKSPQPVPLATPQPVSLTIPQKLPAPQILPVPQPVPQAPVAIPKSPQPVTHVPLAIPKSPQPVTHVPLAMPKSPQPVPHAPVAIPKSPQPVLQITPQAAQALFLAFRPIPWAAPTVAQQPVANPASPASAAHAAHAPHPHAPAEAVLPDPIPTTYYSPLEPLPSTSPGKLAYLKHVFTGSTDSPLMVAVRAVGAYGNIMGYEAARVHRDVGHRDVPFTYLHRDLKTSPAGNVGVVLVTPKTNVQLEKNSDRPALFATNATTEIVKDTQENKRSHTPKRRVRFQDNSAQRFNSINELHNSLILNNYRSHNEISLKHERVRDLAAFFITEPGDRYQRMLLALNRELYALDGTTNIPVVQIKKAADATLHMQHRPELENISLTDAIWSTVTYEKGRFLHTEQLQKILFSIMGGVSEISRQSQLTHLVVDQHGARQKNRDLITTIITALKVKAKEAPLSERPFILAQLDSIHEYVQNEIDKKTHIRMEDASLGKKTKYAAQFVEVLESLSPQKTLVRTNTATYTVESQTKTNSKAWMGSRESRAPHASSSIARTPHSTSKIHLVDAPKNGVLNTLLGRREKVVAETTTKPEPTVVSSINPLRLVEDINPNSPRLRKIFLKALEKGDFTRVKVGLRMGLNPDFTFVRNADYTSTTPLLVAIENNHFPAIHTLLDWNLDMTQPYNKHDALKQAIQQFHKATPATHEGMEIRKEYTYIIRKLLAKGASLATLEDQALLRNDRDLLQCFTDNAPLPAVQAETPTHNRWLNHVARTAAPKPQAQAQDTLQPHIEVIARTIYTGAIMAAATAAKKPEPTKYINRRNTADRERVVSLITQTLSSHLRQHNAYNYATLGALNDTKDTSPNGFMTSFAASLSVHMVEVKPTTIHPKKHFSFLLEDEDLTKHLQTALNGSASLSHHINSLKPKGQVPAGR